MDTDASTHEITQGAGGRGQGERERGREGERERGREGERERGREGERERGREGESRNTGSFKCSDTYRSILSSISLVVRELPRYLNHEHTVEATGERLRLGKQLSRTRHAAIVTRGDAEATRACHVAGRRRRVSSDSTDHFALAEQL